MTTTSTRIYDLIARLAQDGPIIKDEFLRECDAILASEKPSAETTIRIGNLNPRSERIRYNFIHADVGDMVHCIKYDEQDRPSYGRWKPYLVSSGECFWERLT